MSYETLNILERKALKDLQEIRKGYYELKKIASTEEEIEKLKYLYNKIDRTINTLIGFNN